ncbi:RNA polymerase I-specific transcription initiation factor RRN6-like protein [Aspergillus aurantiobrunneus]
MDENSTRSIQYGHFGKAVYHPKTQSWEFFRNIAPPPCISYTGATKTVVQSPYTSVDRSSTLKRSTLFRGYPELIAGYRLARSEKLSHTITAVREAYNPLVSALLDFGRAIDLDIDTSGRRAVPIVAFASGECGNIISFRTVTDNTVELEQATTATLRVPTIGDEDGIEWLAEGVPIRQIRFSYTPEERSTFMAVRFSSTLIFRPFYHRTPVRVCIHRGNDPMAPGHQNSRLDPNFLLEISTSHTGGNAHADVKFNPWNQNQLAIVDEDGNWSIWELRNQHKRNKDNWVAACVTSGTLPWVGIEESQNAGAGGRHDGWLAIEWAGSEDHVIVCDRRCSMLYRTEGNRVQPYSIELGFGEKTEWILDITRSTCNSSHIFILTTSRLIWFDLTIISVRDHTKTPLSPRLSWRHFRDLDDTTLQLASLEVEQNFYLVLFSRLNHLVLAFYCPGTPKLASNLVSVPDPFILHVPPTPDNADDCEALPNDTRFSTLVFKEVAPTTAGKQYLDRGLTFFKAFAVDSSLRIQESLYSKPSSIDFEGEQLRGGDALRARRLRLTGLQKKALNSKSGFIVGDWDESVYGNVSISDRGIDSMVALAEPQFTLDYTQIYAIVIGELDLLSPDGEKNTERRFQVLVKELVNKVTAHFSSENSTSCTALEILQRSVVLDDIDQNAQDLDTFVSQFTSNHSACGDRDHLLVQPYYSFNLRLNQPVKPPEDTKLELVAKYDRLVNHWLVELPSGIPGRTRIAKEKAIRLFVADIVLSQIVSVRKPTTIESTTNKDAAMPVQSTSGLTSSSGTVDEQSSLKLRARSVDESFQSETNITATQVSSPLGDSPFPEHQPDEWPIFKALSSYTDFTRMEPDSRDALRILVDDWKPGIDPASYSLARGESQLAARNKASGRKTRRKMPMAVKDKSLGSSVHPSASSPVLAVKRDWGSQRDSQPPLMRLQSNHVMSDFPMTQVERGAFGGREASKKSGIKTRKKKRAAGF